MEVKKESILANINDLQAQADNTAEMYEKKAIEVAQLKIEASLTEQSAKYEAATKEYENEYLSTIQQAAVDLQAQLNEKVSQPNSDRLVNRREFVLKKKYLQKIIDERTRTIRHCWIPYDFSF